MDYVLTRNRWFLHRNNKDSTNDLSKARRFKTWEAAEKRAKDTSWKYCRIDELNRVELSDEQKSQLDELWFIYGNHGPKSTMNNHKFIQWILEINEYKPDFATPTAECKAAVDEILNKD